MAVKFSFKSSIVVNGKRYGSAEELPDKLRKAYETAVVTRRVTQAAGRTATKIVVNGKEYASPEEMPVDVRKLYDAAMATMDAQKLPASGTAAPDFPVHHDGVYERDGILVAADKPRSLPPAPVTQSPGINSRLLAGVLAIVLLAVLLWFLRR